MVPVGQRNNDDGGSTGGRSDSKAYLNRVNRMVDFLCLPLDDDDIFTTGTTVESGFRTPCRPPGFKTWGSLKYEATE